MPRAASHAPRVPTSPPCPSARCPPQSSHPRNSHDTPGDSLSPSHCSLFPPLLNPTFLAHIRTQTQALGHRNCPMRYSLECKREREIFRGSPPLRGRTTLSYP